MIKLLDDSFTCNIHFHIYVTLLHREGSDHGYTATDHVTDDYSDRNVFANLLVNKNLKHLDRVRILVLYVNGCCFRGFELF
jgi:hypothetical protein